MGAGEVSNVRLLYIDIETAPIEAYVWSIWDQNVGLNQIIKDWAVLSVAWMFEGDQMQYADNRECMDPRDDRVLMSLVWKALDEADLVCTQNGNSFDIRKLNARFITLGMPPPSTYRCIDTKIVAKQALALTSHKLEFMAEKIAGVKKSPHKEFPGFELWTEVLKGNRRAWAVMERYNKQDVRATRALYLKLRPWAKTHPNMGQYMESNIPVCPKCGGKKVHARGYSYTTAGKYRRYACLTCGGWSKGIDNLLEKSKRKSLLRGE